MRLRRRHGAHRYPLILPRDKETTKVAFFDLERRRKIVRWQSSSALEHQLSSRERFAALGVPVPPIEHVDPEELRFEELLVGDMFRNYSSLSEIVSTLHQCHRVPQTMTLMKGGVARDQPGVRSWQERNGRHRGA